MTGKELLQTLVYLDEVHKRVRDDSATPEDYRFERELLSRIKSYEREKGTDLTDLVELAKQGDFCPILYEHLNKQGGL